MTIQGKMIGGGNNTGMIGGSSPTPTMITPNQNTSMNNLGMLIPNVVQPGTDATLFPNANNHGYDSSRELGISGNGENALDNFKGAVDAKALQSLSTKFSIEWIHFQETPEYGDAYVRNYQPSSVMGDQNEAVASLMDSILCSGGVPGAKTLSTHATSMFNLSMLGGEQNRIHIPNGFGTRRMKFVGLIREEETAFGPSGTKLTFLNGFTDHPGVIKMQRRADQTALDDNMELYINSMVTLAQESHVGLDGRAQKLWNVVSAIQVVDGKLVGMDVTNTVCQNINMLRPSDLVFGYSQTSDLDTGVSNWMSIDGRNSTINGLQSHFNNMANNTSTSYLGRIIKPVLESVNQTNRRQGIGGITASMSSMAMDQEYNVQHSPFLRYISRMSGRPLTARFTIADLGKIDPTVSQRIKVFPINAASLQTRRSLNADTTPWDYSHTATEVASKVIATVPALLWDCFATGASFSFTNATPQRMPIMSWSFLNFITPTGLPMYKKRLENSITNVLCLDCTRGNRFVTTVDVYCDTSGDIVTTVWIEGDNTKYTYTFPSFASSLAIPTYTRDKSVSDAVVNGFGKMVDGIFSIANAETGFLGSNTVGSDSYGF